MITKLITLVFCIYLFVQVNYGQTPKKAEVANLNDCEIYYEVYGDGEPLFLLHGYFLSSKYWNSFIADYKNNFEIYIVDLTGHGKSSNFKDSLSIPEAANNLFSLIQYLKLDTIKAIGWSYGGDVLFQLSSEYPDLISSMVTIGSLGIWDASKFPDLIQTFSYQNIENLGWLNYFQPNETRIKWLLDNYPHYKIAHNNDFYSGIKTNTLIVIGDDDQYKSLYDVDRIRKLMPSTDLWILPNSGHDAHDGKNKSEFVKASKEFLLIN